MIHWFSSASIRLAWLSCAILLFICMGCLPFESRYASASREPAPPNDPLAGAWQGEWHSDLGPGQHSVRAIISMTTPSRYDVWIEMSGFGNVVASWIEAPDLSLEKLPDGTEGFQAKLPLVRHNTRGASVWAEAVELQGSLHDQSLRMTYRTNDALRELDHGQVELRRVAVR